MIKKLKIILLIILLVTLIFLAIPFSVFAQEIDNVYDILGQIDLSALENLFNSLSSEEHFNTYLFIWLGQVLVLARRSSLVSRFLSTCLEGSEVVARGLSSLTRD